MTISGSCHCDKISFRIDAEYPTKLTHCTCSFCAKRGALIAYFQPEQFHVTARSSPDDAVYRWHSGMVEHHFCRACGCATYSDSPAFEPDGSWDNHTRRIAVNARLFDDFNAAEAPVEVIDGKNLW